MLLRTASILSLLILQGAASIAQYQSAPVWNFGHQAGVDFTTGSAVPFSSSIYTHSTVSSTQCDANGNVLFYANSFRIWDAGGNPMPNSVNPVWQTATPYISSWNMNAFIVPDASDTSRYFVIQTFPSDGNPPFGSYFVGQLTYSVVDMDLNGGLGDVVPGLSHVLLDVNVGHFMTIVPGAHCNCWIITQSGTPGNFSFKTYEITAQGIQSTPVISSMGNVPSLYPGFTSVGNRAGSMIYSYTHNTIFIGYESSDITAYNFDPATGIVSNPQTLAWAYAPGFPNSASMPAICLSPNEQFLYVAGFTGGSDFHLRQFPVIPVGSSVSLGPPDNIFSTNDPTYVAVQQQTGFVWGKSAMQMGPDNKIYVAFTLGQNYLSPINFPDLQGQACDFVPNGLQLAPGSFTTSGLTNPRIKSFAPVKIPGIHLDTTICFQSSVSLAAPDTNYLSFTWQDGSHGTHFTATGSGVFWVECMGINCKTRIDSFTVRLVNFELELGDDISTCEEIVLEPQTNVTPPAAYLWSDGSSQPTLMVTAPGTYWVELGKDGCMRADTVEVTKGTLEVPLPTDTSLCIGGTIRLNAFITGAVYLWQDGSTESYYQVAEPGIYTVDIATGFCADHAEVNVNEVNCDDCIPFLPSAFTPNNDAKNDAYKPVNRMYCMLTGYELQIYNRWGQQVFHAWNPNMGWDGNYSGAPAEVGTYMYYLRFTNHKGKTYLLKGDFVLVR